MNKRRVGWIVVASLVLVLAPSRVQADDTSLGAVGFAVTPMENTQVTMAAERVEVELGLGQFWVTCLFTFTNTGPATEVLMGFPQLQARPGRTHEAPELHDFRVWVDAHEVVVTFRPQAAGAGEEQYAGWHTFSVSFAAGQTHVVRNTYHGRLTWGGTTDQRGFGYVLHTGANWAGPIGQADVTVRWPQREVAELVQVSPPGYTQEARELRWHFADLEPTERDDIYVDYYQVPSCYNLPNMAVSSGQLRADEAESYPGSLFLADANLATSWKSVGEAEGAWVSWGWAGYSRSALTTLGLGIFPGAAGKGYLQHGRPKEVLVRLAHVKGNEPLFIEPTPDSFLYPGPRVEVTEYRLTLDDAPRWQFLHLEKPANFHAFQIVIASVYPGECYNDVAIAEMLFPVFEEDLAAPPILPASGGQTNLSRALVLLLFLGITSLITGGAIRIWLEMKPNR